MESQPEDTSQPSVRESNNVTESNTKIEMSKDITDRVEIEETSEDNSRGSERLRHGTTSRESKLKPCFNMISRNTLKGDILKIYKDERTKYYNLLGKIKCRIAITTDMWTSSNNKGFTAVTGHFIDDNWTLRNCILRFLYVPAPHTAEVLADMLVEALMNWNIDRKVSTITIDNCTTNNAMINHLLQKLPTKDMPLDGKKMARDILAIPISTFASESAFNSSGKLINPHRNRLHHTTMAALMCSRRWLWNEANDTCSTSDGIQTCPSILDEEDDQDDRDSK
ncbi:putative AC transposase [Sesamum angolense]|uniref:AC transposase n=1 Tax=Sesamum angolense TaxID=2727404 RepID=A0AAE1X6V6_9LAMI|nr:putative AC transposase [Sesamum angolense]